MRLRWPSSNLIATSGDRDAASVIRAAGLLRVSEFEIFRLAYCNWFGRTPQIEQLDRLFQRYLIASLVPHWVREFVRTVLRRSDEGPFSVAEFGIERSLTEPRRANIIAGVMALILLILLILLIVVLSMKASVLSSLSCVLPPCY